MIWTKHGMFVREIVAIVDDVAECRGYGRPQQRRISHFIPIADLKADGGTDEILQRAKEGPSHAQEETRSRSQSG